jgi:flagellar basal-body rod modification protein FlgD
MELGQLPITGPTLTPPELSPPAAGAGAQISSDFEMFLQMLTAQMQYQDPLNPIDSTDYATQLATFSGVEQAVLTNESLESLSSQLSAGGLAEMAAWVGKEARAATPAYFDGQPITLSPKPSVIADSAEIVVRNEAGVEVQRLAVVPGAETMDWAGVGTDGTPMSPGLYSFEIVSNSNGEVVAQDPIEIYSKVVEVRLEGSDTILILEGGASVPSGQVTALRDASL